MKDRVKMTVSGEVTRQQVLELDLEKQVRSLQLAQEQNQDLFADYLWMENEEEFNLQVEEQLREEDFIERCFQEMWEEEERDCFIPSRDLPALLPAVEPVRALSYSSALNPDAKEFIPAKPQHTM
ncbi:polyadenylate-binding protein-interacting protein 2B-like [Synchiropus splendidus]|uniref:polyadenylate-binding protein-interacting protein 2B-like n=1 Tax=Synchiropus splendidus TaxID=270530 RepID=UPI00237D803D|nr:polyadenylate-binding protein-interacting protein 2B-like [Synchiropus splendidus]